MSLRATLLAATCALVTFAGCNSLLGNEEGFLVSAAADGSADVVTVDASTGDVTPVSDGGGGALIDSALTCPPGQKLCASFQACVNPVDPNFGCGSTTCEACSGDNATAVACAGNDAGAIVCKPTCKVGFADCDGKPENGCETGLSDPNNCGGCNVKCAPGLPLCELTGTVGNCVGGCTPPLLNCGTGSCIDKTTDPRHCGGCSGGDGGGQTCPSPPNGSATCSGGICGVECDKRTHKCGNACVPDSDATHCGAGCVDCTTLRGPDNATGVSCQAGECRWSSCQGSFADCDDDLHLGTKGTGCEADLLFSELNCGMCKRACGGGPVIGFLPYGPGPITQEECCNGICQPIGTVSCGK